MMKGLTAVLMAVLLVMLLVGATAWMSHPCSVSLKIGNSIAVGCLSTAGGS